MGRGVGAETGRESTKGPAFLSQLPCGRKVLHPARGTGSQCELAPSEPSQ